MKIALAQINYHTGNFEGNTAAIIEQIEKAKQLGADLIVFSELCITGYPARDFLEFKDFINLSYQAIEKIASHCVGIAAIVGAPSINKSNEGKDLYNSAFFLADSKIQSIVNKSLLPNYDIFDEYRYFEPSTHNSCIEFNGVKIALTICEDLWNIGSDKMYAYTPMDALIQEQPDLMINIAASPFSAGHINTRKNILLENVKKYGIPLFYVNHVGAQTELIFDGGSMVIDSTAKIVDEMAYFDEEFSLYEWKNNQLKKIGDDFSFLPENPTQLIHDALITGIKDYFRKLGFKKAVLGSSGGIDSALVQYLASMALGPENVTAVLMPSRYSSDHSVNDAVQLSKNLGNPHHIISIEDAFASFENTLAGMFTGTSNDITEENLQSRCRGVILMAISNKFGPILLNTSNKSENAVGYGTLYGDMAGGLSVIGDLYKTQVYELARWVNRNSEIIPENIIIKAPSAELRPNQKDSDSLPDYDVLDKILFEYIENRKGPSEIIHMGYDEALVKRILRLVNLNEYKRHQTPPILRVSSKAFGMGRRMPIVAKYLS